MHRLSGKRYRNLIAPQVKAVLLPWLLWLAVCAQAAEIPLAVLHNGGITTFSTETLHEIAAINQRSATIDLAYDPDNRTLWTVTPLALHAYDTQGSRLVNTRFRYPVGLLRKFDTLAVDGFSGNVWLGTGRQLQRFNLAGERQQIIPIGKFVRALSLDRKHAELWLATKHTLISYGPAGKQLQTIPLSDVNGIHSINYSPGLESVWVAATARGEHAHRRNGNHRTEYLLRRYGRDGTLLMEQANLPVHAIRQIAQDGDRGLWLLSTADNHEHGRTTIMHLNRDGQVTLTIHPFDRKPSATVQSLVIDPRDGSIWIADRRRIRHYGAEGGLLGTIDLDQARTHTRFQRDRHKHKTFARYRGGRRIFGLAIPDKPLQGEIAVSIDPPANAAGWHNQTVSLRFDCSGINRPVQCPGPVVVDSEGGAQTVHAVALDAAGNAVRETDVTVNLDKTAPVITARLTPAPNHNGWLNTSATVSFSCTDNLSGVAGCTAPVTVSTEGSRMITGTATDNAGNIAQTQVTVQVDKTAPAISLVQPADGSVQTTNPFAIVFTPSDNLGLDPDSVSIQINSQPITTSCVNNAGTYTCTPNGEIASVNAQLLVTMADLAGNTGSAQVNYSIDRDGDGDGVFDGQDAFPDDPSESSDLDGDGIGDNSDTDRDGDGISNDLEVQAGTDPNNPDDTPVDSDGNGIPDVLEGPATSSTTSNYNSFGLVTRIDGPRTDVSDVTSFDYDSHGNLIRITNALGQITEIPEYDANGRPLKIVDPNGTVTELAYDARGRLLSRTVDGTTTSFEYDAAGNLLQTTLPNGAYIRNSYDAAHRLIAIEDALGNHIDYTLDARGNRIREDVTDPNGNLTRTLQRTYNSLNRLTETLGGAGQQISFGYDSNGNQTGITTDPAGLNQQTTQAFDALNRLSTSIDADNGVTTYTYDARDNLTSVTDPTGLTTRYNYDGLDRLISQDSPDTGITNFAYDVAGNRIRRTDARGITTRYSYDALNRLTSITYTDNNQNVTFIYDNCDNGIGRLCRMVDESGSTDYGYDPRGNVTSRTTNRDGIVQAIAYNYDNANQLTQIIYPDGRIVGYTRNGTGQIESVMTTYGGTSTTLASHIGYQPFGPVTDIDYGNGLSNSRSYDLDYRLTGLKTGNGTSYQDLTYTLDKANNITAIINQLDASRSQDFSYDKLNRLTRATGIYGDLDYSYDAIGNRLSEARDGRFTSYSYDTASHHLLQAQGSDIITYNYDANGNTISNTRYDFNYGDNNRLQQASINGAPAADYVYNGRGERTKKTGIATTYYHYDQSGQLIAETDAAGNTLRDYIYVNGLPLVIIEGNNSYTIIPDHLGTPQFITDQNQNIVWQADYEPFGKTNITTALIDNNLRFPGQYYDQETGLHYNYFRDYDASTGRYVESDPSGIGGGINSYIYTSANPVEFIDPVGLITWTGNIWIGKGKIGFSYKGVPIKIGHTFITLVLESECINHKKAEVSLTVDNAKSHNGFHFKGVLFYSHVTLEDNWPGIFPNILEGDFEVYAHGFGYGSGFVRTGHGFGKLNPGGWLFGGIDITGTSRIQYPWPIYKKCGCEN